VTLLLWLLAACVLLAAFAAGWELGYQQARAHEAARKEARIQDLARRFRENDFPDEVVPEERFDFASIESPRGMAKW
jgi:hypothetical protein